MMTVLAYLKETFDYMLLSLPVWLVFRMVWLKVKRQKPRWSREILLALFVCYLAGLASQTLTSCYIGHRDSLLDRLHWGWGINLTPGRTILAYWHSNPTLQLVNLAGNVLIFVPMGILLPLIWPSLGRWWKTTGVCAGVSMFIEVAQLFLNRSTDVDDFLLNTLGGLLGYLVFALFSKLFSNRGASNRRQ